MKGATLLASIFLIGLLVFTIGLLRGAEDTSSTPVAVAASDNSSDADASGSAASSDAADTTADAPSDATEPAEEDEATDAGEEPRGRYDLPDGGVDELLKFVEELQSFRPQTAQEYSEYRQKGPEALQEAARRIMDLEKDESSDAYKAAKVLLLESRVQGLSNANLDEKKAILRDLIEALQSKSADKLASSDLSLTMTAARSLEYGGESALAADAYDSFAKIFSASDNEQLSDYSQRMEGSARRLRLPGNQIELQGALLGGGELDWQSYRGKVVLVDFWATWCGPCVAELPNVRKNYALYHDKGFDVVGISLDNSRDALESFLEKDPLPWATLFDEESGGWSHPMATYYGVSGIPTVLLVDQEGKVVSLRARGPELGRLLEEQLGPVDEEKRRDVEALLASRSEPTRRRVVVPRGMERAPAGAFGDDNAIYLACGEVNGPGKVYQVDGQGRVLDSIDVPATPYGIDVWGDGLVVACPDGFVMKIAKDGSTTKMLDGVLPAPIDVAADPRGDLVIADNGKDLLVRVPAGTTDVETMQEVASEPGHYQNMAVAIARDGKVLFATNEPEGIYRFSTEDEALGEPLLEADGDVAADRASDRWAASTDSGIHFFQQDEEIAEVPFPDGRSPYRGGAMAFGPDGKLVAALQAGSGAELALVDPDEETFRLLFEWDRERLVNFAVGPRMDWSGATDGAAADGDSDRPTSAVRVENNLGDELAVLSIDPPLPHVFKVGEKITVRFAYTLKSADNCHIWVRPFTDGRRSSGYGAHGSPGYARGSGQDEGWFTLAQPGRIDEVRIEMVTDGEDPVAPRMSLFVGAEAEWQSDAAAVETQ